MLSILKYSIELVILGWQCREWGGKGMEKRKGQRCTEVKGRADFHRLSTWRFIPEGNDVSRVLIHLLPLIFCRHGSRLGGRSITMIARSDSECAPLLKCLATGDTFVPRCAMSNRWRLTLARNGWLVSPKHWRRPTSCMWLNKQRWRTCRRLKILS